MSAAGAECVSAPIDTKSAPVAASSGIRARVTPPEISVFARPGATSDGLDDLRCRQVVEEHDVGAGSERGVNLVQILGLNLDRKAPAGAPHPLDRRHHAAGQPNVVVLDQNAVIQAKAMVGRAAGSNRRTFPAFSARAWSSCVSSTVIRPCAASTNARASVAVPVMRCR